MRNMSQIVLMVMSSEGVFVSSRFDHWTPFPLPGIQRTKDYSFLQSAQAFLTTIMYEFKYV